MSRIPPAEMTTYPCWIIIDPARLLLPHPVDAREDYRDDVTADHVAPAIHGPWFSRAAAQTWLDLHRHRVSPRAAVWCASGHESADWRALCEEPIPTEDTP